MPKKRLIAAAVAAAVLLSLGFMPFFHAEAGETVIPDPSPVNGFAGGAYPLPSVSAQRCALIETGGALLYGRNANVRAGMASTTKIMTALAVLKNLPLETKIKIPGEAVGVEGSSIYLIEGEILTAEELLYGLMLASGNDCAVALAIACSGSVESFVALMNRITGELGIADTHFTNPHGLSDSGHYTSAYSLALITAAALKHERFIEISSSKTAVISKNNGAEKRYLTNHNRLLHSYDGMVGGKTGFTKATGRCLVTAARRDGVTLVAVTLNDGNDWNSHRNMLDYGFKNYSLIPLASPGDIKISIPVTGGKELSVGAYNDLGASVFALNGSVFTRSLSLPRFLYAPVNRGDTVGWAEYKNSAGEVVRRLPIVAEYGVERKKLSFFEKIFG